MKIEDFHQYKWLISRTDFIKRENQAYRDRHPEFKRLEFPDEFFFRVLPDRQALHWAIIVKEEKYSIYFIDVNGQAFDKLEFRTYDYAVERLEKNFFQSNKKCVCPYEPVKPVFVDLRHGKKSAPYSKGNLWNSHLKVKKKVPFAVRAARKKKAAIEKRNDTILAVSFALLFLVGLLYMFYLLIVFLIKTFMIII